MTPPRSSRSSSSSYTPPTLVARLSSYLGRVPRPILFTFTLLTSSYLLTTLLLNKLLSIHNKINSDSSSKQGLRQRFDRNLHDVEFTILALLPSLKGQMDKVMDVDALTKQLKALGKEGVAREEPSSSSTAAAVEVPTTEEVSVGPSSSSQGEDVRTDEPAMQKEESVGQPPSPPPVTSALDAISQPQPEPISPHAAINGDHHARSEADRDHTNGQPPDEQSDKDLGTNGLTDGIASNGTPCQGEAVLPTNGERKGEEELQKQVDDEQQIAQLEEEAQLRHQQELQQQQQQQQQLLLDRKRKTALWQELKILTFTRSLTSIYAIALLSVLTHVQLNLLGRYTYLRDLAGIQQQQGGEDTAPDALEEAWASASGGGGDNSKPSSGSRQASPSISSQTEERYLTFSWYFLHQGCKELGERVRQKVEEVMAGIPLKTQITHEELTSILRRIRRRIEYEYSFEDDDDEEEMERQQSSVASPDTQTSQVQPYTFPGGHTLDNQGSVALGAESLLPNGTASFASGTGSSSVVSASTITTTDRSAGRRRKRRTRTRFDLLRAYLLPCTPEGDVHLLQSAGLVSPRQGGFSLRDIDPALTALLDETRDILESNDARSIFKEALEAAFVSHLLDDLRPSFGLSLPVLPSNNDHHHHQHPTSSSSTRFSEIASAQEESLIRADPRMSIGLKVKLAAVLPLLASRSTAALDSVPNEIVETIASSRDLQAFCAIIYTAFTRDEAAL